MAGEDKEQEHYQTMVERLTKVQGMGEDDLAEVAAMMNEDRNNNLQGSNSLLEELLVASRHKENPFHHSQFPFDINQNTYAVMIKFIKNEMPQVYG